MIDDGQSVLVALKLLRSTELIKVIVRRHVENEEHTTGDLVTDDLRWMDGTTIVEMNAMSLPQCCVGWTLWYLQCSCLLDVKFASCWWSFADVAECCIWCFGYLASFRDFIVQRQTTPLNGRWFSLAR